MEDKRNRQCEIKKRVKLKNCGMTSNRESARVEKVKLKTVVQVKLETAIQQEIESVRKKERVKLKIVARLEKEKEGKRKQANPAISRFLCSHDGVGGDELK